MKTIEVVPVSETIWQVGRHYVVNDSGPFRQVWWVLGPYGAVHHDTFNKATADAIGQEIEK